MNFYEIIGACRRHVGEIETDMELCKVMELCPFPIGCVYPSGNASYYKNSNIDAWLCIKCKGGMFLCEADEPLPLHLQCTDEMIEEANTLRDSEFEVLSLEE